MTDLQAALSEFLRADPTHPIRTIVIALLIGALSAAILHLMHGRKGWGMTGLIVKGFAAMLMIIGGVNFFLGVKYLVSVAA